MRRALLLGALIALVLLRAAAPGEFHFAIVGDRTGEAEPGVWERVWREVAASNPAFVLSVGDVIQGMDDATAEAQWRELETMLAPYRKIPLYLTPGNHDVWNEASAALYRKHSKRELHYEFDYGGAHFTVLDNSRGDALAPAEMEFLEADLAAHKAASPKFIVMHRPSWVIDIAMRNAASPLHQLAKRYGVRWILAGHVHQLIHAEMDGVTYFAAPSSGGHLRLSHKYEDGWFFGWTEVEVKGGEAAIAIHELGGRRSTLDQWGLAGLKPPTPAAHQ
jgi:3',5'-cyclic-AMP phosphodiesterase